MTKEMKNTDKNTTNLSSSASSSLPTPVANEQKKKIRSSQSTSSSPKKPKLSIQSKSEIPFDNVTISYLRKSLLQFFLQDESEQKMMLPIILSLVGCDEEQKQTAVRKWIESHQLINKTRFWPFK